MISANELRIGNWVNVLHGDVQIEKFIDGGVHFTDGNGGNFTSLSPIPLTPEILEKCGFEKSRSHSLDFFHEAGGNNLFCFRIGRPFKHEGNWYPEKKYLHELQNLFFALTGQELSVKVI